MPVSSYGVPYESSFGINFVFDEVVDAPLNKSHKEFGFSEPIYYFGFDKVYCIKNLSLNIAIIYLCF